MDSQQEQQSQSSEAMQTLMMKLANSPFYIRSDLKHTNQPPILKIQ